MRQRRTFHDETRNTILKRRLVTIPRSAALFVLVTVTLPILVAGAAVIDGLRWAATRRPCMALRFVAVGWVFLAAEVVGLIRFSWHWLATGFGRDHEQLVARAWPTQRWWACTLFTTVQNLFRVELVVEGQELTTPGPILAMFRHASIVDNLLPAVLLADRAGYRLRWIVKRELLAEPALDVAGTRLPNYFVDRESSDPRAEIRNIRRLAADLGPDEGVLIYPEGTRFTEERRRRVLRSMEHRDAALYERAQRLRHLLPPRIGGPLTLLDTNYDVVMCGHEGLGGFARLRDLWSGALIGRTVHVRFWRFPAATIPAGRKERIDWLFDKWEAMDSWIEDTKRAAARLNGTLGESHPPTPS